MELIKHSSSSHPSHVCSPESVLPLQLVQLPLTVQLKLQIPEDSSIIVDIRIGFMYKYNAYGAHSIVLTIIQNSSLTALITAGSILSSSLLLLPLNLDEWIHWTTTHSFHVNLWSLQTN